MQSSRADILDWLDQGCIAPDRLREAMEIAGVLPDAARWRQFLDRTLLFIGVAALALALFVALQQAVLFVLAPSFLPSICLVRSA